MDTKQTKKKKKKKKRNIRASDLSRLDVPTVVRFRFWHLFLIRPAELACALTRATSEMLSPLFARLS